MHKLPLMAMIADPNSSFLVFCIPLVDAMNSLSQQTSLVQPHRGLFGKLLFMIVSLVIAGVCPMDAGVGRVSGQEVDPFKIPLPESMPKQTEIQASELPGWIQGVDQFFEEKLVKPLEAILFYDFGTPYWLGVKVPFVVVWLLFAGIYLTIRMGFINVRMFKHSIDLI